MERDPKFWEWLREISIRNNTRKDELVPLTLELELPLSVFYDEDASEESTELDMDINSPDQKKIIYEL